jgi:hypothetical protein
MLLNIGTSSHKPQDSVKQAGQYCTEFHAQPLLFGIFTARFMNRKTSKILIHGREEGKQKWRPKMQLRQIMLREAKTSAYKNGNPRISRPKVHDTLINF